MRLLTISVLLCTTLACSVPPVNVADFRGATLELEAYQDRNHGCFVGGVIDPTRSEFWTQNIRVVVNGQAADVTDGSTKTVTNSSILGVLPGPTTEFRSSTPFSFSFTFAEPFSDALDIVISDESGTIAVRAHNPCAYEPRLAGEYPDGWAGPSLSDGAAIVLKRNSNTDLYDDGTTHIVVGDFRTDTVPVMGSAADGQFSFAMPALNTKVAGQATLWGNFSPRMREFSECTGVQVCTLNRLKWSDSPAWAISFTTVP